MIPGHLEIYRAAHADSPIPPAAAMIPALPPKHSPPTTATPHQQKQLTCSHSFPLDAPSADQMPWSVTPAMPLRVPLLALRALRHHFPRGFSLCQNAVFSSLVAGWFLTDLTTEVVSCLRGGVEKFKAGGQGGTEGTSSDFETSRVLAS